MYIENRNTLTFGIEIESPNNKYIVGDVLAFGGSCIVYYGTYEDNANKTINVLIKEFYPSNEKINITRNSDDSLNIPTDELEMFNSLKTKFNTGYNLQVDFRNDKCLSEGLVNATSPSLDNFSFNNTQYIVMLIDEGRSLNEVVVPKLKDMLEIVLSVAKTLELYHKKGYLHLDIKPENIFKIPETSQLVKLFDFDSVTHIEDIASSSMSISYSNGYAAPEQIPDKEGQINRNQISIKSDIFAVGHLIFEYVFGYKYTQKDLVPKIRYEYDKKRKIFKGVNPRLYKSLDQLFQKTIVFMPSSRYDDDRQLIEKLEELVTLADTSKPYIISNFHKSEKFFVGRENDLKKIKQELDKHHCVVLRWLGGIGKTEIAKKYAEQNENNYDTIIFATYSSDIVSLIVDDSSVPINTLSIEMCRDANEYYEIKMHHLRSLCNEKTLFIIDAMNTVDVNSFKELMNLNCKFLITTRNNFENFNQAYQMTIDKFDIIDEALSLFEHHYKKTIKDEQKTKLITLIEKIDRHTITIELIAKSMHESVFSVDKIFDVIGEADFNFSKLEVLEDGQIESKKVDEVIQKIFDVSDLSEEEKCILMNMSLINYTGIPIEKFMSYCKIENPKTIRTLIRTGWVFSNIVTIDNEQVEVVSLHQVISDVVYKKLKPNTTNCENLIKGLINEAEDFGFGSKENSEVLSKLMDFCRIRIKDTDEITADLIFNTALIIEKTFSFKKAIEVYEKCVWLINSSNFKSSNFKKKTLISACYNNIGGVYGNKGELDKALEYYNKSLNICLEILGEKHPAVATNYNNIGGVYNNKGEHGKALEYYNKSLDIRLEILGKNHPDVATNYNNIGGVYNNKGESDKALEYYNKSLDIRLEILGENHPDVATSYNNIGLVYSDKGESDIALEYYNKVLDIDLEIFGENHPAVATSYNNIGGVYGNKGELDKALEYYNKSLNICLEILGEKHPAVATSYNNIGFVYKNKGENDKALEYYNKSLDINLETFGKNHPSVAASYNNIGLVYYNKGEFDKALEYYNKSLDILLEIFGENHPDVATSYNGIGAVYNNKGEHSKALECYNKSLDIRLEIFGENHPAVATSYNNIGFVYKNKGEFDKALEYYNKSLDILLETFGENHPDVATNYNNIGGVYNNKGEHGKALEYYNKSLDIRLEILGENHPSVATSHNNIGLVYSNKGELDKALEHYNKALDIRLETFGENHPTVATSYYNIGEVYNNKGENDKALEYYNKSLDMIQAIQYHNEIISE